MRNAGVFYELDVLECIRDRLRKRKASGAAFDVGAFVGTHSVYFAKFCGLGPVLSFEANPGTFPILARNIKANGEGDRIIPFNVALGAKPGRARIIAAESDTQGMTKVAFDVANDGATIGTSTLDHEAQSNAARLSNVALIKIDVEGAELEVLAGARGTIGRFRPLLCIEIHTAPHLWQVFQLLRGHGYSIVDCLGHSPTYIFESQVAGLLSRFISSFFWLVRATLPTDGARRLRWYLKRLAQLPLR
jgi:FkbM family methyltransferase